MGNVRLGRKLVELTKKLVEPNTNKAARTSMTIRKAGAPMKQKIHKSGQKSFKNAEDQGDAYMQKVLKDKKHIAGRSKQVTRINDRIKRNTPEVPKKKSSALRTTAKVAGLTLGTAVGVTAGAEYTKKKNAEAKANANKVKVNANKVSQNVSKVNANTFKNYANEEKVAENTRKVAENKAKVQNNAVKVYSNAAKVNAEKARTATTNAQKVAANKAKIEANKKKVIANKAKYK